MNAIQAPSTTRFAGSQWMPSGSRASRSATTTHAIAHGKSATASPAVPAARARARPSRARKASATPKPPIAGASPQASARVFSIRRSSGKVQNAVSAAARIKISSAPASRVRRGGRTSAPTTIKVAAVGSAAG